MKENQPLSPKKIRRVDSREGGLNLADFQSKETGSTKIESKNYTTAGTGGGGDANVIYAPKRTVKKKDFKSRMKLINPKKAIEETQPRVKVLK